MASPSPTPATFRTTEEDLNMCLMGYGQTHARHKQRIIEIENEIRRRTHPPAKPVPQTKTAPANQAPARPAVKGAAPAPAAGTPARPKREISEATRRKMKLAQKKRWAAAHPGQQQKPAVKHAGATA